MNNDRQETLRKIDAWVIRFLSKGHLFGKRLQVQPEPTPAPGTDVGAPCTSTSERASPVLQVTRAPAKS